MIRRLFIALALGFGLAAGQALAQPDSAKTIVDAAKAKGIVGEQGDGFLGFVTGSADPTVTAAVDQINAGRAQVYKGIAARTGVSDAAAGEATAVQLFSRTPAGEYYRPLGGAWTRK